MATCCKHPLSARSSYSLAQRLQSALHLLYQSLIQLRLRPPRVCAILQQQLKVCDAIQLMLQLRMCVVAGFAPRRDVMLLALRQEAVWRNKGGSVCSQAVLSWSVSYHCCQGQLKSTPVSNPSMKMQCCCLCGIHNSSPLAGQTTVVPALQIAQAADCSCRAMLMPLSIAWLCSYLRWWFQPVS